MRYQESDLARDDVDAEQGNQVLVFGTNWCGYCKAAMIYIEEAENSTGTQAHWRFIEDGPGRRLGRSFRIKQWPTLVFLCNGVEIGRVVRPESENSINEELQKFKA